MSRRATPGWCARLDGRQGDRRRRVRLVPACPIWWWASTGTACRSTARRSSSNDSGYPSSARRWPIRSPGRRTCCAPSTAGCKSRCCSAAVMHVDSTSIPVRDSDSPRGIHVGSLWGYVGDTTCAVYLYTSTGKKLGQREGEMGPEQFLALRKGPVVADAANLFDASFESDERVEVGCNMHGRRYFVKALDAGDARATNPIAAFRALYDVEDAVRGANGEERHAERQRRSKPVLRRAAPVGRCAPPRSNHRTRCSARPFGTSTTIQLVALTRFLDDGALPIDNGIVERLHRRPAIGRRNYCLRAHMRAPSVPLSRTRSARPAPCSASTPSSTWLTSFPVWRGACRNKSWSPSRLPPGRLHARLPRPQPRSDASMSAGAAAPAGGTGRRTDTGTRTKLARAGDAS